MNEGFVVDSGGEYYCDKPCLHTRFTEEEWGKIHDEENYWTEWYDCEDEYEYIETADGNVVYIDDIK